MGAEFHVHHTPIEVMHRGAHGGSLQRHTTPSGPREKAGPCCSTSLRVCQPPSGYCSRWSSLTQIDLCSCAQMDFSVACSNERDPEAASAALRTLEAQVADAAGILSATPVMSELLNAILSPDGPARRAGDRPLAASDVQFLPDDGTLAGILRAVQQAIALDQAGPLALGNHGSTTTAMLAAATSPARAYGLSRGTWSKAHHAIAP